MSAYLKRDIDLSSDDTVVIPLNGRWVEGNISVAITFAGTGTVSVNGSLSQVNRGDTLVPFSITNLSGVTADAAEVITNTPLEALQVVGTGMAGGGASVQILAAGDC